MSNEVNVPVSFSSADFKALRRSNPSVSFTWPMSRMAEAYAEAHAKRAEYEGFDEATFQRIVAFLEGYAQTREGILAELTPDGDHQNWSFYHRLVGKVEAAREVICWVKSELADDE